MELTKINGDFATAALHCKAIEDEAIEQIRNICNHPAMAGCNIEIMPDAHSGKGCVIGFTSTINDKIIPNLVGVDIGCGMAYAKFSYPGDINFEELDKFIREHIPSGFDIRDKRYGLKGDEFFQFTPLGVINYDVLDKLRCKNVDLDRAEKSVGTLGGGNHFIEIDKCGENEYYLVVHSGSRYLGKQICEYYQNLAYEKCKSDVKVEGKTRTEMIDFLKSEGRQREIQSYKEIYHQAQDNLTDKDTAYLQGKDMEDYINDANICKLYAQFNREVMVTQILNYFGVLPEGLKIKHTIHNYIDTDEMIIRKGAIKNDEECLIPINMRDGAFIVSRKDDMKGKWNNSLPHGAGRLMSRNKARESIGLDEYRKSMEGIRSSCVVESTIDESPMAYKSIDNIRDVIEEVCVIKEHIKPVYNFKAS